MPSPFSPSSSVPGQGIIHLTLLPPSTPTFSTLSYTYPLKLVLSTPHILNPSFNGSASEAQQPSSVPLLFLLTYGGGIVSGDTIVLDINLEPLARLTITTQGSTKIFRAVPSLTPGSPKLTSRQSLHVAIGSSAGIWLGPDPTQPFAGSRYAQMQMFDVKEGGSVGILDWVTEGRRAMGEKWDFEAWRGKNELWRVSERGRRKLVLRDSVILEGTSIAGRMDGMGVFGTLILMGKLFEGLGNWFLEEFRALPRIGGRNWGGGEVVDLTEKEKWRKERVKTEVDDGVLWTAAEVRGLVVVKFGASEVEGARTWLGAMIKGEGSVQREFGDGALMCVR